MPASTDGILDAGRWDEADGGKWTTIRDKWTPYWKPVSPARHARWFRLRPWSLWSSSASPTKLHPTAYLDGLRGFAALLVYWHHHQLWAHSMGSGLFQDGFGFNENYYFAAAPGVRTFFTGGHFSVTTFLVISGYVLSLKPLSLVRSGNKAGLSDHLASALFRRWIRLYLPLLAVVLIYAVSWHVFGIWVRGSPQQGSLRDEIWNLYVKSKNFTFVFNAGGDPFFPYNTHLWSIPVEFKGSIVVYTTILAFSTCTPAALLWCLGGLMFYFMYIVDGWYCSLFLAGTTLCLLDQLAADDELPRFLARLAPWKTFISYHLLLLSIYLGGVPSEVNDVEKLSQTRGWYFLSLLKPQAVFDYKWFYLFWAATMLVAAVPRIGWLKRFFETSMCQYLGKVSYGLYLVHGPILNIVGDRIYVATGWGTPESMEHLPWWANKFPMAQSGPLGLEPSFLATQIILLPLTLFVADLTTKGIDGPSVRFASRFYKRVSAESAEKRPTHKSVCD